MSWGSILHSISTPFVSPTVGGWSNNTPPTQTPPIAPPAKQIPDKNEVTDKPFQSTPANTRNMLMYAGIAVVAIYLLK